MQNTHIQFSHPVAYSLRLGAILFLFFGSMLLWQCTPTAEENPEQEESDFTNTCTQPPSINTNWAPQVHPNCFSNLERLAMWTKDTLTVLPSETMDNYFVPVAAGSIKNASTPIHLYVVTHGWAPGLSGVVDNANYNIQWWDNNAKFPDGGTWESSWFWTPTYGINPNILVSATGMVQQITAYEKAQGDSVIVLAYSWIDDSATALSGVQYSEAYTNINGIRMAEAIQAAVGSDFLAPDGTNKLHLIGHSHGSKVVTVAAMELQEAGLKVDHLTILDSPEEEATIELNGANFLGYYLNTMTLQSPGSSEVITNATFVDSYASNFGVAYSGGNLDNVVNIGLKPAKIFADTSTTVAKSDEHAYSGTWYSGAAVGAQVTGNPPIGLAWPPVTNQGTNWYQGWDNTIDETTQWQLTAGSLSNNDYGVYTYSTSPCSFEHFNPIGKITGTPADTVTFTGEGNFYGKIDMGDFSDNYGLAYRMNWANPKSGDYIVVTAKDENRKDFVIQVFDGKSIDAGWHNVSFNAAYEELEFNVFFIPADTSSTVNIQFTDFNYVVVGSAS